MKAIIIIISLFIGLSSNGQFSILKTLDNATNFKNGICEIIGSNINIYDHTLTLIQTTKVNIPDSCKIIAITNLSNSIFDNDEFFEFLISINDNSNNYKVSIIDNDGNLIKDFKNASSGGIITVEDNSILFICNLYTNPIKYSYSFYSIPGTPTKTSTLKSAKITAFPNPTDGNLTINGAMPKPMFVINSTGQVVKIINPNENTDLSGLAPDTYILNNGEQSIKVVVK